eukprot:374953-Hanusia_phi.AAC.1
MWNVSVTDWFNRYNDSFGVTVGAGSHFLGKSSRNDGGRGVQTGGQSDGWGGKVRERRGEEGKGEEWSRS